MLNNNKKLLFNFLFVVFGLGIAYLFLKMISPVGYKAKLWDNSLKSNLNELRSAVELFKKDCGVYPYTLDDLITPKGSNPNGWSNGEKVVVPAKLYKGPYFQSESGVLGNQYIHSHDATKDWIYSPESGRVSFSFPVGKDHEGKDYSSY